MAPYAGAGHGELLSDTLTRTLLADLTSGAYRPGDRLPPEREIAERFGVSRTVVREAVRTLASRGVITVRSGAGLFVARPDATAAVESIRLLVRGASEMTFEQVHEVRETIEIRVAGLAAQRATDADLENLAAALDRLERAITGEDHALADGAFHLVLADLAHNLMFRVVLDSIGDVILDVRRQVAYLPGNRERVTVDHRRIAEAVARHDPDAARQAMEEHLRHSRDLASSLDKEVLLMRSRNVRRSKQEGHG